MGGRHRRRRRLPEGSGVQLMPNEVIIMQQKAFNRVTRDWEFVYVDVSSDGSKIFRRGFVTSTNALG